MKRLQHRITNCPFDFAHFLMRPVPKAKRAVSSKASIGCTVFGVAPHFLALGPMIDLSLFGVFEVGVGGA